MIMIDRRTGSRELEYVISSPHVVTDLQYADASFLGCGPNGDPVTVGIERKTIMDLVSSMTTGRLSGHQLVGLLNSYSCVYLLVEGLWRPGQGGLLTRWTKSGKWKPLEIGQRRFMYKEIANFLNTLAVACGIKVWQTGSLDESGTWIDSLYGWWQKDWEKHRSHMAFEVKSPPAIYLRKPKFLHRVAKEFSGVGWDKGKALATHFGTLRALVTANPKEYEEVEGIGKVLAKSIGKEINGNG